MPNTSRALSWIARLRSQEQRTPSSDWADMGTAFGLDQSLQAPAEPAPQAKEAEAAKPATGRRWPAWRGRKTADR